MVIPFSLYAWQELSVFSSSLAEVQSPQSVTVLPVSESSKDVLPAIAPIPYKDPGPKGTSFAKGICPFSDCQRKYGRPQDLERHILQHLPHWIHCPRSGCNWTGNRLEILRAHLKKKHRGAPLPQREMFIIYNAKRIVKQLLKKEVTIALAEYEAWTSFEYGAVRLGILSV